MVLPSLFSKTKFVLLSSIIFLCTACTEDPVAVDEPDPTEESETMDDPEPEEEPVEEEEEVEDPIDMMGGVIGFSQSGPVGGGFPNVVSWDPNVPGKIYYGSDIGGTGRSTNYGRDFESAAHGLGYQDSHKKIAALNAVNVNGSTVIVGGTGFRGIGGEVISSADGGDNWQHDSSDISFSAQNSSAPLPTGRPRSTDPSLIQWVGGATWVAGTYDEGVWISTNNRASWSRLNVFGGTVHVRAMAVSSDDPNTVYVGLWGDHSSIENKGLWEIRNINGAPNASRVADIPDVVESIAVLGNRIYVACGRFGVRSFVPSTNTVSDITGPIGTSVMATAIHGVGRTADTDRVVVGTAEGNGDIWVSDTSGASWTNTTASGVSVNPWGNAQDLLVFQRHPNWAVGRAQCDVAAIQVSPHDPDAWVVCSTSAIWTTTDAGTTWRPANGFQILTYRDVEISSTGVIAAGNVDHDVLVSTDGGTAWESFGFGGVTVSHALGFSPDGSELAFANNERDNNTTSAKVGVAASPDTPASPSLTEINYPAAPKRVVGLSWVTLPDGRQRLINAVDDGGIQTVDRSNGNWSSFTTRTTAFMGAQSNNGLRTSVVSNGASTVFVYDRNSGVWRSTDYGVSWAQILNTAAGPDTGYLAYSAEEDILYIATPTEVLRMDNATNSNAAISLGFPTSNPGAMAVDPAGRLLVYVQPSNSGNRDVALYRNQNPETNQNSWTDIADATIRRVAPPVTDIDASANYIVLVTAGKGMLVSENDAAQ